MLLINPHLLWGNTFYRYMEVHLTAPDYDLYGAPQIGFPVPVIGFNKKAGWGRTVNTIDTVDYYRLTVRGNQYEFDGKWRDFARETKTIRIKQADGSFEQEQLLIRSTVHGPVVYDRDGLTIAMRVAGLDRPKMLEQWFRMGEAQNLAQFQSALRMMAIPMWNANYADADGHIMLVFDGLVPQRQTGDFEYWSKLVPGNTSKTLWSGYLSYEQLPKSLDPPSGFNQNTNEPPWSSTFPELDASKYPPFIAPPGLNMPTFRTKRSLRMMSEHKPITYEQFVAYKHSTRMELADALLPDLLKAAEPSPDADVKSGAGILQRWDRQTEADSRGAVLFQIFTDKYFGVGGGMNDRLRVKYDPVHPLDSAYGLSDFEGARKALAAAVIETRQRYGSSDVAWGDVFRYASGTADLPANGGSGRMGVFRTIQFGKEQNHRAYAVHGETFVCAIEFSVPQKAQCLLGYGNATQPNSPHLQDQLRFMVKKQLHPVWRERTDVEAHLEGREILPF